MFRALQTAALCALPLAAFTACGGGPTPQEKTPVTTAPGNDSIADPGFLKAYAATYRYRMGLPRAITLTPNGEEVLFLRSGPRSFVGNLYAFDTATGKERVLLTAEQILGGAEENLTDEEKARRERMRLAARGITSFTLTADGKSIIVPLSGRLFMVERASGKVTELKSEAGFPIDPRLSPDGKQLAAVRGGDLYVMPIDGSAPERRLTTRKGPDDTVSYGAAEFVAQEEMARYEGYWWSPDSQSIVYQRTDTAGMEIFQIADPSDPSKAPQKWPYPRPGGKNADVQLFVQPLGAEGAAPVEIKWDRTKYPYLNTVRWPRKAPLTLVVQDRRQRELVVLTADPKTGETKAIHTETDNAWLNLDQTMPHWLPDGSGFLWASERSGSWQLEVRNADGSLKHAVTPKGFNYMGFARLEMKPAAAKPPQVYVYGGDDPTEQHLFRVALEGGSPEALTTAPGVHEAVFSRNGFRVMSHASIDADPQYPVFGALGAERGQLKIAAEKPAFDLNIDFVDIEIPQAGKIKGAIQRPRDFDPKKQYPVIVYVYAGPHAQVTLKSRNSYLLTQWFADHGFVVVRMDGRGTPHRGRDWERAIVDDFITVPLHDQAEGVKALLARFPEMDPERVGIFGWSFGGYFSAMATMRRPDVYAAGVAGAPVADWRDYDTHYTERYIGVPDTDAGKAIYDKSSVLTYAKDLKVPLLITHGTADDNVYFMHGLKMSSALFDAGRAHSFLPLAGATHMVSNPEMVDRLYSRIMDFFEEHLGQPTRLTGR
ncbi:MAG: DPP IV N-terminal domain-containing protein [Bradymonadia bacterium]